MLAHPRLMTFKFHVLLAFTLLARPRLVFLVLLAHSVQTLHHHLSVVKMDLTVWVLQLSALIVHRVIFVIHPVKIQFHNLVRQANTATSQPRSAQNAVLDTLVKDLIFLQHHHLGFVQ